LQVGADVIAVASLPFARADGIRFSNHRSLTGDTIGPTRWRVASFVVQSSCSKSVGPAATANVTGIGGTLARGLAPVTGRRERS
jgi:hypothetical protein